MKWVQSAALLLFPLALLSWWLAWLTASLCGGSWYCRLSLTLWWTRLHCKSRLNCSFSCSGTSPTFLLHSKLHCSAQSDVVEHCPHWRTPCFSHSTTSVLPNSEVAHKNCNNSLKILTERHRRPLRAERHFLTPVECLKAEEINYHGDIINLADYLSAPFRTPSVIVQLTKSS